MILSDVDIREALGSGKIKVTPAVRECDIRPTGIRLHLARTVACPEPNGQVIELSETSEPPFRRIALEADGIVLGPGQFILASSVEQIFATSDVVAHLDGRSTLARLGIMIHCGSTLIDNIHEEPRAITLEIKNLGPFHVRLKAGDSIGMIFFSALRNAIAQPASAQYRGQAAVTPPVLRRVS